MRIPEKVQMRHNPWADMQLVLCDKDFIKSTWKTPETLTGVFQVFKRRSQV